jgi:hypothetical protein
MAYFLKLPHKKQHLIFSKQIHHGGFKFHESFAKSTMVDLAKPVLCSTFV